MPQPYVASDLGGFHRLAQIELQKKREKRLDADYAMRRELTAIQLKEARSNIAEIGKQKQIQSDLGTLYSQLPEGENKFTAGYKYLMENGHADYADKYMKEQSNAIEKLWKIPGGAAVYAAVKLYNNTIGKVMGAPISLVPGKKDLVKAEKDGKTVYMKKTPSGFEEYKLPEGVEIDEEGGFGDPTPEKIEFWARQSIATGKKVFNVRGKEANRLNNLIERKKADILLKEGVSGEEATYLQKDREAIQKSIAAQEKQRGSMANFVINLGKQIDHVKEVAKNIKTVDARFLNKPIRWLSKKVQGDPDLAKYEIYLSEIQSEIGKLSLGATGSVSELSQGAREHWEQVLDKNLSLKDMIEVIEEVKKAGYIRLDSVDEGLEQTRGRLRAIGDKKPKTPKKSDTKKVDAHEKPVKKAEEKKPIDFKKASNEELEKILRGE